MVVLCICGGFLWRFCAFVEVLCVCGSFCVFVGVFCVWRFGVISRGFVLLKRFFVSLWSFCVYSYFVCHCEDFFVFLGGFECICKKTCTH